MSDRLISDPGEFGLRVSTRPFYFPEFRGEVEYFLEFRGEWERFPSGFRCGDGRSPRGECVRVPDGE